jgi:hypothetical protein
MSNFNNLTNYNKISLKSESAAELVRELAKLGVFKRKRKSKARAAKASDEIQQITQGMTPQQVADVQARNNAAVAILRAEVERNRFEQSRAIGGLGQTIERFRAAQDPGAGVLDPFKTAAATASLHPDIHEGASFTETLNPGAPGLASEPVQTEVFAEEEGSEEGIQTGEAEEEEAMLTGKAKAFEEEEEEEIKPRIVPRENIEETGVTDDRKRVAGFLGVKAIPPDKPETRTEDMLKYYKTFISKVQEKNRTGDTNIKAVYNEKIIRSRQKMHKAILEIANGIFKEQFGKVGGGAF